MVGTHLLPPNLLKLFTPRPPLPYAKPTGRDPDLPLKSLSARRAPQPVVVAPLLHQLRAENEEEDRLIETGVPPGKGQGEGEDQGLGEDVKINAAKAEVKMEEAGAEVASAGEDTKMAGGDDKEEGEEASEGTAAAKAATVADTVQAKQPKLKADQPTDAVTIDLCAEEQFQLRKRERERRRKEAMSKSYAPQDDEEICGDPYKTLFVGRLPHDVTEKELLREFDLYGPIERIRLVTDPETGQSRGYAFIVYERERDMKAAYKDADGLKMKGQRLLIDVERGRTVKGWKPRRLGGGLGGRIKKLKGGIPAPPEPSAPPPFMGGGIGGGYRGGYMGGGGGGGRGGGFMGGGGGGGGRGGYMGGGGRGGFGGPPRGGGYMGGGGGGGYPPRQQFGGPPPPGGGFGAGGGGPGGGGGGGGGYGPPGGAPPAAPGGGGGGRGGFSGGGIGYGGIRGAPPASGGGGYGPGAAGGFAGGEKRPYGDGPGGGYPPGGGGGGGGYGGGDEKRLRY